MSTTFTCTSCGATMRADQSWCSLCYAQVAEPFDPLTAPLEEVLELADDPTPVDDAATEDPPPAPPRPILDVASGVPLAQPPRSVESEMSDPVAGPVDADAAEQVTDVDVMLSMLAAEHRAMDPTTALTDRFEDKSTRIAIMVGGTVLVGAVLFLLFTLLGVIF